MKLFQALCRYRNNPNGNIFTGKHRIVKPVTYTDINKMKNQVEIEEKNMFYLRHPYLTVEQSFEHAKALGKPEANFIKTKTKPRPFYDNVTIESRLAHLRVSEAWD